MIGISFKAKNEYGKILSQILYRIDVSKYYWEIPCNEILIKGPNDLIPYSGEIPLFKGSEFLKLISSNMYYVITAELCAYESEAGIDMNYIKNLEDFLNSNCELIIIIDDCEYVDVYCKNIDMIEVIKNNAINCGYTSIEYITGKNDLKRELRDCSRHDPHDVNSVYRKSCHSHDWDWTTDPPTRGPAY